MVKVGGLLGDINLFPESSLRRLLASDVQAAVPGIAGWQIFDDLLLGGGVLKIASLIVGVEELPGLRLRWMAFA